MKDLIAKRTKLNQLKRDINAYKATGKWEHKMRSMALEEAARRLSFQIAQLERTLEA